MLHIVSTNSCTKDTGKLISQRCLPLFFKGAYGIMDSISTKYRYLLALNRCLSHYLSILAHHIAAVVLLVRLKLPQQYFSEILFYEISVLICLFLYKRARFPCPIEHGAAIQRETRKDEM
jgi:hypothetical protein